MIAKIKEDLAKTSAVDNTESLVRELAVFNSYLVHVGEMVAYSDGEYRRKRAEVGKLDDVEDLTVEKFKVAVDSGSSPERAKRIELEYIFKAICIRIESLQTMISFRKTELNKMG